MATLVSLSVPDALRDVKGSGFPITFGLSYVVYAVEAA